MRQQQAPRLDRLQEQQNRRDHDRPTRATPTHGHGSPRPAERLTPHRRLRLSRRDPGISVRQQQALQHRNLRPQKLLLPLKLNLMKGPQTSIPGQALPLDQKNINQMIDLQLPKGGTHQRSLMIDEIHVQNTLKIITYSLITEDLNTDRDQQKLQEDLDQIIHRGMNHQESIQLKYPLTGQKETL